MSAQLDLIEVDTPVRYLSEAVMVDMLRKRYSQQSMGAHRYAVAHHVPSTPLYGARIADFIAVDCWRGNYPAKDWFAAGRSIEEWGYPIHGHEIKASRPDWLTELRDPSKAEAFRPYCDYWWLVVSDQRIVRDGELPKGWGLIAAKGDRLVRVKQAFRHTPAPMPRPLMVSMFRAIAKAAKTTEVSDV